MMIYAVINSKKRMAGNLFILVGAVVSVIYTFLLIAAFHNWYLIEIVGMLLISAGAFLNGRAQGKVQITHHIVRGVFEAAVVLLFVFG